MARRKFNKRPKLHIKKGDDVKVLSGRERGKTGRVLVITSKVDSKTGLNLVSKHRRPDQQNPQGGIVETEAAIHISNLQLIDPKSKAPTRIGRKVNENGKGWVRYSKKSGEIIG
ncbi:UNVERIFIED_CONTAM: hypothetical protein GTU68_003514 [Idotea baltica]|nr:hypothetical protein [Idotea baltica]